MDFSIFAGAATTGNKKHGRRGTCINMHPHPRRCLSPDLLVSAHVLHHQVATELLVVHAERLHQPDRLLDEAPLGRPATRRQRSGGGQHRRVDRRVDVGEVQQAVLLVQVTQRRHDAAAVLVGRLRGERLAELGGEGRHGPRLRHRLRASTAQTCNKADLRPWSVSIYRLLIFRTL